MGSNPIATFSPFLLDYYATASVAVVRPRRFVGIGVGITSRDVEWQPNPDVQPGFLVSLVALRRARESA